MMRFFFTFAFVLLAGVVFASENVMFEDLSEALGLDLENKAACWVDVDNDGWPDIVTGGVYWRNDEGRRFTKEQEGLGSVVAADYDNDGFTDLFSYRNDSRALFRNEGGKRFVEVDLPEIPELASRAACWGDFNGDGFVDIYLGGYENWKEQLTFSNVVLINEGGKGFKVAKVDAGFRTRGVSACDFDRKNGIDIYVSNYRLQANQLFVNDGKGEFRDEAEKYGVVATSGRFKGGHSIGATWGDFDNDGWMDIFAGNFAHVDKRGDQPKSRFLKNRSAEGEAFEDLGACGIFYQESYASPATADYDNDGKLDLFFTTVYENARKGPEAEKGVNNPVLFRQSGEWKFEDVSEGVRLEKLPPTYQAAWGDFNRDGHLDLVTAGKLYVNTGGSGNWLAVRLAGDGREVNRSAIGAQVRLSLGDEVLTRQVEAGTNEGNQNELVLHFGLGNRRDPVDLEILWPNGEVQKIKNVEPGKLRTVIFGE
ncbi:MAG: CRTAC1 family protein [Chthoniobacterales bacterium]